MQGSPSFFKIFDKTRHEVVKTHYEWYGQLMEGLSYLFESCKNNRGEKKDNGGEYHNDMEDDKNGASDSIPLDAKPGIDFNVYLIKPRKVEKRVGTVVRLGPSKIIDLKLMSGFVANYLVDITPLKNFTSNTFHKASIAIANFLANIIANSFNVVSLVNFFVVFISSFVKDSYLGISMVDNSASTFAKSFTNNFVASINSLIIASVGSSTITSISLFVKTDMLDNLSANVLSPIKSLIELVFNTTYND